jgi:hypothetical protein
MKAAAAATTGTRMKPSAKAGPDASVCSSITEAMTPRVNEPNEMA